jgi:hypothetical protein
MFGFLKKKKEEPEYDVTNLTLHDLNVGFVVDYDMKSWVVREAYEYDWGNENFSKEYKMDSGDEVGFLSVEEDGEMNITFTQSIKLRKIDEDIAKKVSKNGRPPRKIHYEGETFYLDSDSAGYFRDCANSSNDWQELISWEYYNEEEDKVISITQWDEETFEAFSGPVLEPYHFSTILPGT